jgi:hypothetical protein
MNSASDVRLTWELETRVLSHSHPQKALEEKDWEIKYNIYKNGHFLAPILNFVLLHC